MTFHSGRLLRQRHVTIGAKDIFSKMACSNYRTIAPFHPPAFAKDLPADVIPKSRVSLGRLPTPVHEWSRFPDLPSGFTLGIKRDDLTHSTLTGNKIRKLEFLLAAAVDDGCDAVITAGSLQTNHGRATAVAARELGLDPYLVVRSRPSDVEQKDSLPFRGGNVLVDMLVGAGIVLSPWGSQKDCLRPRMEKLAKDLAACGKKSHMIPIGGSDSLGLWGYMCAFQEMVDQGVLEDYDDIVHACGSGGTASGLAIANYLCGSPLKIHSICVSDDSDYFHGHIDETLESLQLLGKVSARDIVDVVEGYKEPGYGMPREEADDLLLSVSRQTGIILDSVYTAKALFGAVDLMRNQPDRFKGRRVLFIHTGGLLSVYGQGIEKRIEATSGGQTAVWYDDWSEPPVIPK